MPDIDHPNYLHFYADLAEVQSIPGLISPINELDICINCAGIAKMNHSITMPVETAVNIFMLNSLATFMVSRECAKKMMAKNHGRIVNFSTVAVPLALDGECIYAASKASIENMTRVLAKEFGRYGITVNCVGPNPVQTDLIKGIPEHKIDKIIGSQAIKEYSTISDICNIVDFFCSDQSHMITGQTIYLGGIS